MPHDDLISVRVRRVSAQALDDVRPLAQRHGFSHTNADAVRFAVLLVGKIGRRIQRRDSLDALLSDIDWPRRSGRRSQNASGNGRIEQTMRTPGEDSPGSFEFP